MFAAGEFRVLFAGMLMYVLGFEFEILGLSVLVFGQTRSAFLAALAFSMGFAPQAVGGALFTSLADRLPPRALITAGLLTRAAPGLVIGLWPTLPIPAMLALVAAAATVAPVFSAAISGLLPDVLGGDRYVLGPLGLQPYRLRRSDLGLGIGGAMLAALPARWLLVAAGGPCWPPPSSTVSACASGCSRAGAAGGVPGGRCGPPSPATPNCWPGAGARPAARAVAARLVRHRSRVADRPLHRVAGPAGQRGRPLLAAVPAGMLLGEVLIGRFCRPRTRQRLAFPLVVAMGAGAARAAFRPPLPLAGLPCWYAGSASLTSSASSRPSSTACRNGCGAGVRPQRDRGDGRAGPVPPAAGGLAAAFGAGTAMAVAGVATMLAALALRGPLTGRAARQPRRPG